MRLWKLSYTSTATAPHDRARRQLDEICSLAQVHNALLGITGVLTLHRGKFAQVLEGPESAVRALWQRIILDPRHHSAAIVADGPIFVRRYSDWSMAYREPKSFLSDQLDDILQQTAEIVRAMNATWH